MTVSERLLATQTRPPADGDPGGAAAGQDRGRRRRRCSRSIRRTVPVEALLTQSAAGADREPQRRRVGGDAAPEDPAAVGVDRGDPGAVLVGDPDPAAAEDDRRPGWPPTSIRRRSRAGCRVDPQDLAGRAGSETQTEPRADRDAGDAAAELRAACPTTAPRRGSIRVRVPSRALVTQTAPSPAAIRSGRRADRDRRGDGDPVAARAGAKSGDDQRRRRPPRPPAIRQRRAAGAASRSRRPPPRAASTRSAAPGLSESTRVAAGVAPSRSRAASISAPAVG